MDLYVCWRNKSTRGVKSRVEGIHVFIPNSLTNMSSLGSNCPSITEVLRFPRALRWNLWNDPTCSTGCFSTSSCVTQRKFPCCFQNRTGFERRLMFNRCVHQMDSETLSRFPNVDTTSLLRYCTRYLNLPLTEGKKSSCMGIIPRTLHIVDKNPIPSFSIRSIRDSNSDYILRYYNDSEARNYIYRHAGIRVGNAYDCIRPTAYRGDLFRFVVLFYEGGLYMDADIAPLVPLEELYDSCSEFTLGHDIPQGNTVDENDSHFLPGMQQKILASVPRHAISKCMIDNIVRNVEQRSTFSMSRLFLFSGPSLLYRCYERHTRSDKTSRIALWYHDTRNAQWPYSGLRRRNKLLAFEQPSASRHMIEYTESNSDVEDYGTSNEDGQVYTQECALPKIRRYRQHGGDYENDNGRRR